MPEIDLHKLANMPGFGVADRVLSEAGHPREHQGGGRRFTVSVEYSVGYRMTVEIDADSADGAKKGAEQMARCDPEGGREECFELHDIQVEEIPPT